MAVSILLGRALAEAVENAGVKRAALLTAARIDPARLDRVEERLQLHEYDRLQEAALALSRDPAIGLRIGEGAKEPAFSLIAHLLAYSRTLRDGLRTLLRFQGLLSDRPIWRMDEAGRSTVLHCEEYPGPRACHRLRSEMIVGGMFRLVRYFTRDKTPERVAFAYAPPSYRDEYTRVFGGLERFDQRFTGIVIGHDLLDSAQPNHDPAVLAALEEQASLRLGRLTHALTYSQRVRGHVAAHPLPEGRTMNATARALGLSIRSLRRRLQAEGASFQGIVDDALTTLARQHLADPQRPIKEVAAAFGFADQASFCRAFKRWSGTTPSAYRARAVPVA